MEPAIPWHAAGIPGDGVFAVNNHQLPQQQPKQLDQPQLAGREEPMPMPSMPWAENDELAADSNPWSGSLANPSNMGPSLGLDDTISPPYLVRLPLSTAGSGSYDDASKPNIPSEPPPAVLDVSPVSPSNRAEHSCTRKFLCKKVCARKFVQESQEG